ncbi:MAG: hypothetical protein QOH71_2579 [Blastocatellia bacterium]|nr:hypothetical protein [Blastocatellia bacterium]
MFAHHISLLDTYPGFPYDHTLRQGKSYPRFLKWARMSMVDGLPYKEEVGGSSPSAPTMIEFEISDLKFEI